MLPTPLATALVATVLTFVSAYPMLTSADGINMAPSTPTSIVAASLASTTDASSTSESISQGPAWKDLLDQNPVLKDIASCESGIDPAAVNYGDAKITGYPSYGLLSFQPGTFRSAVKKYNLMPGSTNAQIDAAIMNPVIQIEAAKLMIEDGQGHQWSCYYIQKIATKYPWTTSAYVSKHLDSTQNK